MSDRVYFIGERGDDGELTGLVKVGCAASVYKRLSALQCGNPRPLEVLKTVPGYESEESEIHSLIWPVWHVQGEWYAFPEYALRAVQSDGCDSPFGFKLALAAEACAAGVDPAEMPWRQKGEAT